MIRRGKQEGWLALPPEALLPWATLNEVSFDRTLPGSVPGKGSALLAKEDLNADQDPDKPVVLLTVSRDLILSLERVREHAKIDRDFREVLESLDDFGRTPRGAILSFLLVQASVSCPGLSRQPGVHTSFSDYIKSLPLERLPTFWSSEELALLVGTTLAPAISAKLKSLRREYDMLCSAARNTRWYQAVQNHVDFEDWLHVDAMYRSRALDFPEIGHCMVPCIDLANHAAGEDTIAIYEKDSEGDAVLLLRDGKNVPKGDEVTITYGDNKGASEMLFSYGFLDRDMASAAALFLSLDIPENDRFRIAKARMANCAPGFKIRDVDNDAIEWDGAFVWLLCVTEEDDLHFQLARTVNGEGDEMQALFQGQEIAGGAEELHSLLMQSDLWDVYRLRAVAILQQRVFDQLQLLYGTQEGVEAAAHGRDTQVQTATYGLIMELRQLEFSLLEKTYEWFESQKIALADSPVVVRFLARMNEGLVETGIDSHEDVVVPEDEDFS